MGLGLLIIKPLLLRNKNERKAALTLILFCKAILALIITLLAFSLPFFKNYSFLIIFITVFCSLWKFIDLYCESLSRKIYRRYFLLKAVFSIIILIIKIFILLYNQDWVLYLLTAEGLFSFFFSVFHNLNWKSTKLVFSSKTTSLVASLVKEGRLVWLSSVLEIGGARLIFIIIEQNVSASYSVLYYFILRIVEGLYIIPNNICANLYQKVLLEKNNTNTQILIRNKMMNSCINASYLIMPLVLLVTWGFLFFKDMPLKTYFVATTILLFVVVLSFFRAWLNREIILNKNYLSLPVSYTLSAGLTLASVFIFANYGIFILFCLLLYYISLSFFPLIVNKKRMDFSNQIILEKIKSW